MPQPDRYLKSSEDTYFKEADIVVSDWWLLVGDQQFDLSMVSSVEMIEAPRKSNWPRFFREQAVYMVIVVGIVVIFRLVFHWTDANYLLFATAGSLLSGLWRELTHPLRYSLRLNTKAGPITVITRDDNLLIKLIAGEIDKRLAHRQLTGPLLSTPASSQQQSGEPTMRIQAK